MAGSEERVRWWVVIQAIRVETWYGMVVGTGVRWWIRVWAMRGFLERERGSGRARGLEGGGKEEEDVERHETGGRHWALCRTPRRRTRCETGNPQVSDSGKATTASTKTAGFPARVSKSASCFSRLLGHAARDVLQMPNSACFFELERWPKAS